MEPSIYPRNSDGMVASLSFEMLETIESSLDYHELVSMVFLLYEEIVIALEYLIVAKINYSKSKTIQQQLISDWVKSVQNKNKNWSDKILEALIITESYAILRKLGYSKIHLERKFLPRNPNESFNIQPLRKAFYIFCESLTVEEIEIIITEVNTEIGDKTIESRSFIDEPKHLQAMELNLLYWSRIKYINIDGRAANSIDAFTKVLERLNPKYKDSCTMLLSAAAKRDIPSRQMDANNLSMEPTSVAHREHSLTPDLTNDVYKMEYENAGIVVIINQKENRKGSDFDKNRLENVFQLFGFKVFVFQDLRHYQFLEKVIEGIMKFKPEHFCFIVVILSHGIKDYLLGSDGKYYGIINIEEEIQKEKYKNLITKPKILIIESCQTEYGENKRAPVITAKSPTKKLAEEPSYALDGLSLNDEAVPYGQDFLVFQSCIANYAAVRDLDRGTWFIQSLCEVLEKYGTTRSFQKILQETRLKVTKKRWGNTSQVPIERSTLIKDLYFKTRIPQSPDDFNKIL